MLRTSLRVACLTALLAAPLAAQESRTDLPPEPRARSVSPQTFAERASPATFGSTIIRGGDGHLQVSGVEEGSPAAVAGLRADDHIVSVDGQLLTEPETFNTYLAARPTSPIQIVVLRDGKQETIVVNPTARATTTRDADSRPALGLRFVQGPQVVVADTVTGSPAEAAGLQRGDQIISVHDHVVTSSDEFITLVAAAPLDEPLALRYLRGTERNTVSITPAAWDAVFASTSAHTTLKPVAPVTVAPVVTYPAYAYPSYNPYYISNVSPVVVPLTWYGYYPYGAAYWNYPYYYGYYPGYFYYGSSPYWNYAWPYGPRYGGPYPGPVYHSQPASELDSAGQPTIPSEGRTVGRLAGSPDA